MTSVASRDREYTPEAPPGTYVLDGRIYVRRFAPVQPGKIECRLRHPMKVRDRPLSSTPRCDNRNHLDGGRCSAHLYLYKVSDLRYLALDITQEEADAIHANRMDLDDVIVYFGLDMPRML